MAPILCGETKACKLSDVGADSLLVEGAGTDAGRLSFQPWNQEVAVITVAPEAGWRSAFWTKLR